MKKNKNRMTIAGVMETIAIERDLNKVTRWEKVGICLGRIADTRSYGTALNIEIVPKLYGIPRGEHNNLYHSQVAESLAKWQEKKTTTIAECATKVARDLTDPIKIVMFALADQERWGNANRSKRVLHCVFHLTISTI